MQSVKSRAQFSVPRSEQTNRPRCRHRRSPLSNEPIRTVVDDSGSLAITAWTCTLCGNLIEELHFLSRDGTAQPYPIRHAVAPQAQTRRLAALSVSR